jgi:hypothetical protein
VSGRFEVGFDLIEVPVLKSVAGQLAAGRVLNTEFVAWS